MMFCRIHSGSRVSRVRMLRCTVTFVVMFLHATAFMQGCVGAPFAAPSRDGIIHTDLFEFLLCRNWMSTRDGKRRAGQEGRARGGQGNLRGKRRVGQEEGGARGGHGKRKAGHEEGRPRGGYGESRAREQGP
jgi:hypothetical protein